MEIHKIFYHINVKFKRTDCCMLVISSIVSINYSPRIMPWNQNPSKKKLNLSRLGSKLPYLQFIDLHIYTGLVIHAQTLSLLLISFFLHVYFYKYLTKCQMLYATGLNEIFVCVCVCVDIYLQVTYT